MPSRPRAGCGEFASDPTLYARCMRRAADLTPELSALANTLTRVSSAHYAAFVQFLEGGRAAAQQLHGCMQPEQRACHGRLPAPSGMAAATEARSLAPSLQPLAVAPVVAATASQLRTPPSLCLCGAWLQRAGAPRPAPPCAACCPALCRL